MDYFKTSFNFTNILFPVVYYHYTQKDITGDKVEIKTEKLNFRLCNESSMKNINDIHHINIPLEDLYCIDMDDLKMGGSWVSGYFHYLELDFYIYKNEINYHSEDSNCTSYENLTKIVGEKNSLQLNFYYPVVNFQLNNLSKPVIINYKEYNYHLSRYSNKISRIYLQENILEYDLGWFY